MKRITEISLCNYRAFLNKPGEEDKYKIILTRGENLLIYGENGSGKSSLFKGLEDFFLSAEDAGLQPNENIFSEVGFPDSEVKVNFSEKQTNGSFNLLETIVYNNESPTTTGNVNLLNSSKAFLTYRDILQTYLIDNKEGKNPNLFNLFIYKLLGRITDDSSSTEIYALIDDLELKVSTIPQAIEDIKKLPDEDEPDKTKEITIGVIGIALEELQKLEDDVIHINLRLFDLLNKLLVEVNRYLKEYFNINIKIEIDNPESILSPSGHDAIEFELKKELYLVISYFGKKIDMQDYPSFLNEARLSAIAICLYLAAVKQDKPTSNNLKFIFLDDIFIGIDTSNRIPLLQIIAEDLKDFQIFISTYDREWFELAKRWMNQTDLNFRHIELYEGIDESKLPIIPIPILIDPSLGYLERAKLHYEKKDYPAAANYLRKKCESEIKRILPKNMQLKEKEYEIVEIDQLGELYDKFKKYCQINSIQIPAFNQFETYTKIIFNSLSHDDLVANHYKKEIEAGISLVAEFNKFKTKEILKCIGYTISVGLWDKGDETKTIHNYNITLTENLNWIQFDNQPAKFSITNCVLEINSFRIVMPFKNALIRILDERGYDTVADYNELCKIIQVNSHKKKLKDIMKF